MRHCVGDGGLAKAAVIQELEARVAREVIVAEGGLEIRDRYRHLYVETTLNVRWRSNMFVCKK